MPAPRELPSPDPAMTERVVAAALEALPPRVRRRRRVLSLIAITIAVAGIVLFDGRGRLVQDGPLGRLRPALCR